MEEEEEEEEPVLIEVGINGGDGGGFDVRRSGEVGETFGEVDGVASLGEKRQFLNRRRSESLRHRRQLLLHAFLATM